MVPPIHATRAPHSRDESSVASVKRRYTAVILILLTLFATYAIWLGSMWYFDDWYENRYHYLAKVGSMGATMLMCWSFILAARIRWIEQMVGGLDKMYQVHHFVGASATVLILLHPMFLAFHLLPDWGAFGRFFWFSSDWTRNLGLLALISLLGLVAMSLWRVAPYHIWKQSHNFFGPLLVLVIIHLVVADGEIMAYPLLGAWFFIWCAGALGCYLYIRVLYHYFGPLYHYEVVETREDVTMVEIFLKPVGGGRRLIHRAGQFVYVHFVTPRLRSEPHPFSISSAPESQYLRLSIKKLGDWTEKMPRLDPGVLAVVWGPYGMFGKLVREQPEREAVLIAGGIGITPFISMVEDPRFKEGSRLRKTYLFYSVEHRDSAYYHDALTTLGTEIPQFEYHFHSVDEKGYLTVETIQEKVGTSLADKLFLICGPPALMRAITQQLKDAGVPPAQIVTEDFSLV